MFKVLLRINNNEKEVRISTPEETLDYLNDTSKFPEEDDE